MHASPCQCLGRGILKSERPLLLKIKPRGVFLITQVIHAHLPELKQVGEKEKIISDPFSVANHCPHSAYTHSHLAWLFLFFFIIIFLN